MIISQVDTALFAFRSKRAFGISRKFVVTDVSRLAVASSRNRHNKPRPRHTELRQPKRLSAQERALNAAATAQKAPSESESHRHTRSPVNSSVEAEKRESYEE